MTEQSILEIYGVEAYLGQVNGTPYVVSSTPLPRLPIRETGFLAICAFEKVQQRLK